jgi:RHS repeat-associated protein
VLEEQANSTGYYMQRYVWSPNYVNEMVSRDTDTSGTGLTATGASYTRLFVLQDANYDVVALVNTSGTVVERYAYDPFGAVTVLTGGYGSRSTSSYSWIYGFQGGRQDTITGDNHFGARNEDPGTGTWTSMDPKGFAAGDDDLYGLEGNSPIDKTDPVGLQPLQTNPPAPFPPPIPVQWSSGEPVWYWGGNIKISPTPPLIDGGTFTYIDLWGNVTTGHYTINNGKIEVGSSTTTVSNTWDPTNPMRPKPPIIISPVAPTDIDIQWKANPSGGTSGLQGLLNGQLNGPGKGNTYKAKVTIGGSVILVKIP